MARGVRGSARSARRNNFMVYIEGAKELESEILRMGDKAADYIDASVKAGGKIALAAAKANTAAFKNPTGNLEKNIVMKPVTRRAGHGGRLRRAVSSSVTIGAARTKKGAADDAYYGSFVELGTKYQKAVFYLRDAVDRNKQAISDAITSHISKIFRG